MKVVRSQKKRSSNKKVRSQKKRSSNKKVRSQKKRSSNKKVRSQKKRSSNKKVRSQKKRSSNKKVRSQKKRSSNKKVRSQNKRSSNKKVRSKVSSKKVRSQKPSKIVRSRVYIKPFKKVAEFDSEELSGVTDLTLSYLKEIDEEMRYFIGSKPTGEYIFRLPRWEKSTQIVLGLKGKVNAGSYSGLVSLIRDIKKDYKGLKGINNLIQIITDIIKSTSYMSTPYVLQRLYKQKLI